MTKAMRELGKLTYAVEHNPNCPSRFRIRIVGRLAGVLDFQLPPKTNDVFGHGKTLENAARNALAKRARQQKIPFEKMLAQTIRR